MKKKTLLFVLIALLGTSIQSSFAGTENCTQLEKLLLRHQKATHDIKEEEWFVWDPKKSSVEVARFVEREDGTWGFARLSKGELPLHTHKQEEWYFIKQGLGRMQLGDAVYMVEPGEKIYIPGNIKHSIRKHPDSEEDLVFEFFFPNVENFNDTVIYNFL